MKDTILEGPCETVLKSVPSEHARLCFADPPFNLQKVYGGTFDDNLPDKDYWAWARQWLRQLKRICARNGHIAVMCHWTQQHKFTWYMERILSPEYYHRQTIQYNYEGRTMGTLLKYAHQPIILFSSNHRKGFPNCVWSLDAVRLPHNHSQFAPRSDQTKRGNPLGRNPTDVWKIEMVLRSTDRIRHPLLGQHPCQAPEEITDRLVQLCTRPYDLVLDPFGGTGTTAVSAKRYGRHYLLVELESSWAVMAQERIAKVIPVDTSRKTLTDYF